MHPVSPDAFYQNQNVSTTTNQGANLDKRDSVDCGPKNMSEQMNKGANQTLQHQSILKQHISPKLQSAYENKQMADGSTSKVLEQLLMKAPEDVSMIDTE